MKSSKHHRVYETISEENGLETNLDEVGQNHEMIEGSRVFRK